MCCINSHEKRYRGTGERTFLLGFDLCEMNAFSQLAEGDFLPQQGGSCQYSAAALVTQYRSLGHIARTSEISEHEGRALRFSNVAENLQ